MLSKKEYIKEQKDCAAMLGLSFPDYQKSLQDIKITKFTKPSTDDEILNALGLTESDLKGSSSSAKTQNR